MSDIFKEFHAPFDERDIYFRVGPRNRDRTSGMPLAYIDARDVMDRLDKVVGPTNWGDTYHGAGNAVVCELHVRNSEGEWLTKSDAASQAESHAEAGEGIDASKSAVSNAFKRAAVKFGIGRYLYYAPKLWYPLQNQSWFSDETMHKIRLDFGSWQRDWFGGGGAQQQPQAAPPAQNNNARQGVVVANDDDYNEFFRALSNANHERKNNQLPALRGPEILHELKLMNYRVDGITVNNWKDLKQFGRQALLDLARELDARPCLVGGEVPF